MKKSKVTLKDIAQATNLSVATVSLVINGKGDNIPDCTRQKVHQAVRELDYHPNYTARSLATGKSQTAGVIVPDISNAFFAESVRHLQVELNKYNYDIILCNSEEKMSNDLRYIKLLSNRNVDGLILAMSAESMQEKNSGVVLQTLKETALPYVFFDRYFADGGHIVSSDNKYSGYTIAKLLLDAGHTNLGVITGPTSLNSSKNRLVGFTKAMSERGLSLPESNIYHGQYDVESGYEGAKQLLANKGITAIFAFNDLQAFGVMQYAKEQSISIPQQVSLVGFDDTYFASMVEPKLTSIKQPIEQMSVEASKMLVNLINNVPCPTRVRLKTQLITRDSVKQL